MGTREPNDDRSAPWPHPAATGPEQLAHLFCRLWAHSPDGMLIVRAQDDGALIVEAINPAATRRTGLPIEDIVGRPLVQILPEGRADTVVSRYHQCLSLGEPIAYEETQRSGDGQSPIWSVLLVPVRDHDTGVRRVYVTAREITHLWREDGEPATGNAELEQRVDERTRELRELNKALQEMATRDGLTHCYNRRYFFELAALEVDKARRHGRPLSILMIDADRFKRINDEYGHAAGDRILERIAASCQASLRTTDILGRYGGEEFSVLLPETDLDSAVQVGERIRAAIETEKMDSGGEPVACTVSVGAGTLLGNQDNLDRLLQRADRALLEAKGHGRNRVVRSFER